MTGRIFFASMAVRPEPSATFRNPFHILMTPSIRINKSIASFEEAKRLVFTSSNWLVKKERNTLKRIKKDHKRFNIKRKSYSILFINDDVIVYE